MVIKQFYISNDIRLYKTMNFTGLYEDEIIAIVGTFAPHSHRAGKLRGKVVQYADETVEIRTSFGNKLLWSNNG